MNHDSVVEDWRQNAESNDAENYDFLRSMKAKDYGFDPDELAGSLGRSSGIRILLTKTLKDISSLDLMEWVPFRSTI